MSDQDPPEIKDHAGKWDEVANRIILLSPFLLVAAVGTVAFILLGTAQVRVDATITGTIPATLVFNRILVPLTYLLVALMLVVYVLAIMKFYGASPLAWVLNRAHNLARNYNPPTEND